MINSESMTMESLSEFVAQCKKCGVVSVQITKQSIEIDFREKEKDRTKTEVDPITQSYIEQVRAEIKADNEQKINEAIEQNLGDYRNSYTALDELDRKENSTEYDEDYILNNPPVM